MQLPDRSTLSGGLFGLAVWALSRLLAYYHIEVSQDAVTSTIVVGSALIVHFVPDSLKSHAAALNVDVKDLAAWLPEAKYPDDGQPTKSGLWT